VPVGPTFRSLSCRLATLREDVEAATSSGQLGSTSTKLLAQVAKATERARQAETECAASNPSKGRSRLAKAVRETARIDRTLRSRRTRRSSDPAMIARTRDVVGNIRQDMINLRRALACPETAGGRVSGEARRVRPVTRSLSTVADRA
jgi:hypothetical protein